MSPVRLSRSGDLQQLRNDGYEVTATDAGHLIVDHVPYVNAGGQIAYAQIISKLVMAGDETEKPVTDHVVFWTGDTPCDQHGTPLPNMVNGGETPLEAGLTARCSFSCKPPAYDSDYYVKMTRYVAMLEGHAQALDSTVTAQTHRVVEDDDPDAPFVYPDTASSRAGIAALHDRLRGQRVAIVGAGGTGSYIFDLVSKTPVKEIHLFDGDNFLSHNAFRAPGAASFDALNAKPKKVGRLAAVYSVMKRGIVPHPYPVTADTVDELRGMDMVFLSMEGGAVKRMIVEKLTEWGQSFIDVGLAVKNSADGLRGHLRVTTSTPAKRDHVASRIDFSDPAPDDIYDENIQIAELNALNAALAVIKWKKMNGVYADLEYEHNSTYTLDGNSIDNEDPSQ
jgi:hypothetical protein